MQFESLGCKPQWFSKPDILGTHLSSVGQALGCLLWTTKPSLLKENLFLKSLLIIGCHIRDGVFSETASLPLQPLSVCSVTICCKKVVQLVFRPFSDGVVLYIAPHAHSICSSVCRFSVAMGKGEFRIFLCHRLGPPFFQPLF